MEFCEFNRLLGDQLRQNGISELTDEQTDRFYRFAVHLLKVNEITNLTAIRTMPEVITKHFVDSLLALSYIPSDVKLLDLGCGAGFPSIPLAIARPNLQIVALDSTAKKIAFVNESASLLGLTNLKGVSGRAEDVTLRKQLGLFDVVTSRAVARLNVLCELCIPYLTLGGTLLALKAAKADEELNEARKGIQTLGGGEPQAHWLNLALGDGTTEPRCVIEVKKRKQTPAIYPRAYAAILKKPL